MTLLFISSKFIIFVSIYHLCIILNKELSKHNIENQAHYNYINIIVLQSGESIPCPLSATGTEKLFPYPLGEGNWGFLALCLSLSMRRG